MKKIVITGGHFTPGYAIIPELGLRSFQVYWIGEKKAMGGTLVKTLEAQVLPGMDIPFYTLNAAKFHRGSFLRFIFELWKFPVGLAQSLHLLWKIKPDVVLSFGSYLSLPVCLAAWVLQIPVVIHEQTAASGLANRICAKFARFAAISFASSLDYFPKEKTILVGNLVRGNIYRAAKRRMSSAGKSPFLYITGGSRGAHAINEAVFEVVEKLLAVFKVYHQTGTLDLKKAKIVKKHLTPVLRKRYFPKATLLPNEVEDVYAHAGLIIARAGANTVSEIAVCGIPALFIPLPQAESDEQSKNAQLLKNIGLAEVLPQSRLSGLTLLSGIRQIWQNMEKYKSSAPKAAKLVPQNAAARLVELLEKRV